MANIPVGWPPADIAAANMQVPVSIRGRSAIDIPACHVMWQISLPLLPFFECPNRHIVYGGFETPCMKRVIGIVHQL